MESSADSWWVKDEENLMCINHEPIKKLRTSVGFRRDGHGESNGQG